MEADICQGISTQAGLCCVVGLDSALKAGPLSPNALFCGPWSCPWVSYLCSSRSGWRGSRARVAAHAGACDCELVSLFCYPAFTGAVTALSPCHHPTSLWHTVQHHITTRPRPCASALPRKLRLSERVQPQRGRDHTLTSYTPPIAILPHNHQHRATSTATVQSVPVVGGGNVVVDKAM